MYRAGRHFLQNPPAPTNGTRTRAARHRQRQVIDHRGPEFLSNWA